jgi:hypothetical protein
MPKTKRPVDPRLQNQKAEISFAEQPVIAKFVQAIKDGGQYPDRREIVCIGTRGDGKTIGEMVGTIEHARVHHAMGFPLPVPWVGVTDTFTSHKLKTVKSFENPIFKGGWRLSDNDHVATFYLAGTAMVRVDLFGIEDQGAMDRMRMETVGMWFEEPAPSAVMVQSTGINEDAWNLGLTSQRIPSHFHPAVITENYPDEDHWTWRRANPHQQPVFAHPAQFRELFEKIKQPWPVEFDKYPQGSPLEQCHGISSVLSTVQWFRVPAGERASEIDRLSWADSLSNRLDMVRRLLLGQPGVIMLGDQVAHGFTRMDHTTRDVDPIPTGEMLYIGLDFGHTPTCIIGFRDSTGTLRVKAGLHMVGGMQQLCDDWVLPWLSRFAPYALKRPDESIVVGFDPSGLSASDADITENAVCAFARALGFDNTNITMDGDGVFQPSPIKWDARRDVLVRMFERRHGVVVEENPYTNDLIKALDGRWYYARTHQGGLSSDKPKKPNHPWEDLGDAFIYLLCRYGVSGTSDSKPKPPLVVKTYFDPRKINRGGISGSSSFDPRRRMH